MSRQISPTDFNGATLEQLSGWAHGGSGHGDLQIKAQAWNAERDHMSRIAAEIDETLKNASVGYEARSADAAQVSVSPLSQWGRVAAEQSEQQAKVVQAQADSFAALQSGVPHASEAKPVPEESLFDKGVAYVTNGTTDHDAAEAHNEALRQKAIAAFTAYQNSTQGDVSATPFYEPPVAVEGVGEATAGGRVSTVSSASPASNPHPSGAMSGAGDSMSLSSSSGSGAGTGAVAHVPPVNQAGGAPGAVSGQGAIAPVAPPAQVNPLPAPAPAPINSTPNPVVAAPAGLSIVGGQTGGVRGPAGAVRGGVPVETSTVRGGADARNTVARGGGLGVPVEGVARGVTPRGGAGLGLAPGAGSGIGDPTHGTGARSGAGAHAASGGHLGAGPQGRYDDEQDEHYNRRTWLVSEEGVFDAEDGTPLAPPVFE